MSRMVSTVVVRYLLAAAVIAFAAGAPAQARAATQHRISGTPVPSGLIGMNISGPLFNDNVDLNQQLDGIVASGVQTLRVVFNWAQAQPYRTMDDVPPDELGNYLDEGGVPTNFAATDAIVGAAATRGLSVLPVVMFAPGWDAGTNRLGGLAPPADPSPYAGYLRALIARYGPSGTFWETFQPRKPVREWQIWNEPNLWQSWPQPFAHSYVKLLRAAHSAVKGADPGARVVLGAITNTAWTYLAQIYRIRGARKLFDVIAVNGFTSTPRREILFLKLVRRAVNRLGDPHKPLLASEISWPSAAGQPVTHHDWDTTPQGQARNISLVLPMLAAQRASLRLAAFYYFTWVSQDNLPASDDFSFAGLTHYDPATGQIIAKPALAAFRTAALRLERCQKKGLQATRCVKRLK